MEKTYTCIVCPVSCRVTVEEHGEKLAIAGFSCKRGREYAENEHRCPKRMITTTIRINNGVLRRLPVVSSSEMPKEKMKECLDLIYATVAIAPVRGGDVIISNVCDTGVDIIASRDVDDLAL